MTKRYKSIGYILGLILMSSTLNGCIALALAPTALSLAAEGLSVHATGQTITENLKEAILNSQKDDEPKDELQVASLNYPGFPPRKPTPPQNKQDELSITGPIGTIGFSPLDTLPDRF